jgi:hypothetical protein
VKRSFHIFLRKLQTLYFILTSCSNWPVITLATLALAKRQTLVRFRTGLRLRTRSRAPLPVTWGEMVEPAIAIADVYRISQSKPDFIIDIGAHIGGFTCFAAHAHPMTVVHAFEPSTEQANTLQGNVVWNRLTNVVLHRHRVTSDGREVIFSELGTGGSSGIFLHEGGRSNRMRSVSLNDMEFSTRGPFS